MSLDGFCRKSLRKQGEQPEFGMLEPRTWTRNTTVRNQPQENHIDESVHSFKSVASSRKSVSMSVCSRKSINTINRLRIQAEVKAMEEEARLEAEVVERQRAIIKRKLDLEMSRIDEEAENILEENSENQSQTSRGDRAEAGIVGAEEVSTNKKLDDLQKWFKSSEIPVVSKESCIPDFQEPTKLQMLARKTIGRDLPPFSGLLEEWGAFIFQFRQSNSMCGFSDAENLYRLQRSLRGKARETVNAMLVTPGNVTKIIEILERRFGRPENIIQAMMKQVKNVSGVKEDKPTTIVEFGTFVQNLVVTIENLNRKEYLLNPQLLSEMVQKLSPTMRINWGVHCQTEGFTYVSLRHFADWMENVASAAQRIEEFEDSYCEEKYADKRNENHYYREETVCTIEDGKPVSKNCHFCNKSGHFLRNCKNFVKLHLDARWKWVKEGRRCFCCLETGHGIPQCTRKIECGLNDCDRFHHKLLHCDKLKKSITESEEKSEAICNAVHSILFNTNEVLLGVLPVVLKGPAGEVKTFALTDDGSTATIIEESLADELGLTGPNEVMRLKGLSPNSMKFPESRKTTLQIQGIENKEKFKLNARTVENIELPSQSVNFKSLCDTFPYLKKVKLSSQENVKPRILIGSDNIHLIVSRDLIEGREDEPLLSKTKLGWIVKGNTVKYTQKVRKEYTFLLSKQMDEELHQPVKESFKTETFGVAEPKRKLKSKDEERADEILEKETRRVGVRWETALIWKCDDVHFHDSKIMALNRLKTVERKIGRNCFVCKLSKAKPQSPMMGELPACRLQSEVRAFTHTGMDYFGPFSVTVGRRNEKRYGVLFTCLTTRAIHLEIANSLTTDSAIQAIRRMIARRGYPLRIYSDNGTNLRGADEEMKKALQDLKQDTLIKEMSLRNIEWFFIPLAAPHMGGSWERLVRSVKTALHSVLKERSPKDETLSTLFVEAESIVNVKCKILLQEIWRSGIDWDDTLPQEINHNQKWLIWIFSNDDLCLRKQWRIAQHFADMFWKRWIREYLPNLTRRSKWHEDIQAVKVSDLVIIADNTLSRSSWPKGLVVATFPGKDGRIRVADVKTASGIYRRPVTKLCVVDITKKDNEPLSVIGGKNVAAGTINSGCLDETNKE